MKMYDTASLDFSTLPGDGDAYLGYSDAKTFQPNYHELRAAIPVEKPVFGLSTVRNSGIIVSSGFDVETYDWVVDDFPAALDRWQPLNPDWNVPILYVNKFTWPTLAGRVGTRPVLWLIADWTNKDHLLPGAWGVQWTSTDPYDVSTILNNGESHPMESPAFNPPLVYESPVVDGVFVKDGNGTILGYRQLTKLGRTFDWNLPHVHNMDDDTVNPMAQWTAGGRQAAHFDHDAPHTPDEFTVVDTAGERYHIFVGM